MISNLGRDVSRCESVRYSRRNRFCWLIISDVIRSYWNWTVPPLSVSIVVGERNPAVGKPFSLPCHVSGSRPIPKITWWRNDVLLDPSVHNQVTRTSVPSSYRSPPFDSKWHGNLSRTKTNRSTLVCGILLLNTKKNNLIITIIIKKRNSPRRFADAVVLYCVFGYSSVITSQTLSINGSVAVSVLDLSLDKTEMNSRITCRAVNPYLDSTVMEDTWNVNLSRKSLCPFCRFL